MTGERLAVLYDWRRRFRIRNEDFTKSLKGLEKRKPLGFWSQGHSSVAEI